MDTDTKLKFVDTVWSYYHEHGRHDLPWRQSLADGTYDPYRILVSEIMLQQTQVPRVLSKYAACMALYPNSYALAHASFEEVLRLWNGLGYNRRAKYLWQAVRLVETEGGGVFPRDQPGLTRLPGVGVNTAGAIMAYSWNQPVVFLETNIRTVFIHHFFGDTPAVSDTMLLPLVEATVPKDTAREWYWALMDYGSYLKQAVGNAGRASTVYARQSPFEGSRRQLRGKVLKALLEKPVSLSELEDQLQDDRLPAVLQDLTGEGIITATPLGYAISATP